MGNNLFFVLAVTFPALAQAINTNHVVVERTYSTCLVLGNCGSAGIAGWAIAFWCLLAAFVAGCIVFAAFLLCRPRKVAVANNQNSCELRTASPTSVRRRSISA